MKKGGAQPQSQVKEGWIKDSTDRKELLWQIGVRKSLNHQTSVCCRKDFQKSKHKQEKDGNVCHIKTMERPKGQSNSLLAKLGQKQVE